MLNLLTHRSRFLRTGGSFVLVLVSYWVYGVAAVPLIEPEAEIRQTISSKSGTAKTSSAKRVSEIDILFGPDDWERRDPVILENQRGKLLIGDYKNNPDGSVSISPCTIIMLPAGDFESDEERIRQAVVMQAVDRAVLRFDEPFDIRKGSIGKLVSGTLQGPILIRSDQKQPGPRDDLWIETRDVQLSEETITTDHAVKFRWGANHGSGRQMRIDLLAGANPRPSRGPQIDGLKAMTLFREVRLHLVPDQKQMQAATRSGTAKSNEATASGTAGGRWKPLPIEVTCKGPFRFDMEQQVARFQERVDVLQIQPEGPSDQISGELLSIFFASKDPPPPAETAAAAKPGNQRLQPTRLEMTGNPVTIRSPANSVHARGQRLEYDLPTRRLSLAGDPEVVVTRGGDEIRARELHYQPGDQGRLGKFLAVGPGWLRGMMPQRRQPVEARWQKQLWVRPDPDAPNNDVVSLEGAADVRVPGMGGLQGDEIYCWLFQRPVVVPPATPGGASIIKTETAPDRLLARRQVRIDSPQLTGKTEQLEAWFEHPAPPPAATGTPATTVAYAPENQVSPPPPQGSPGLASLARPRGPAAQQFDIAGKLVRVKLLMKDRETELSEVVIDGQARFAEIPSRDRPPAQPPLLVEGDVLHVMNSNPQQATVTVTGKPAHVEAGGMGLRGAAINLSRGTNQLWIDGDGQMTMQVDRDMQGRPLERPQPLDVQWQGRMLFNGLTATFERAVAARTQQQLLRTELLEITLTRRIDFAQPKQSERPDVARVVCRGGMVLDGKTYDERGLASIEHMETADFSINRATGEVVANAFTEARRPAVLIQVRRGDNRAGLAIPGAAEEESPPKDEQTETGEQKDDGLSYLYVQFHRSLTGNLNMREMTFGDRVKTVYGPVPNWESTLTPDKLGERGLLLNCDRMVVREMPTAKPDVRATELEAIGNTSVEGSEDSFRASAAIIRYSSGKGKLTLEGDGRRSVDFVQRSPNGASRQGSARIVEYWPEKRHLKLTEVKSGGALEPPRK